MATLRLIPSHWYNWDFALQDGDTVVAEVDTAEFRDRGEVHANDRTCRMRRVAFPGDYVLEADDQPLVRAERPSLFSRRMHVTFADRTLILEPVRWWSRRFVVRDGDEVVGRITPDRWYTRKSDVELPEALPLAVRAFVCWLVVLFWRQAARSS